MFCRCCRPAAGVVCHMLTYPLYPPKPSPWVVPKSNKKNKNRQIQRKHKKNVHRPALSVKIYLMSHAIISCDSSDYLAYECVTTVVAFTFTTYHALPDNTHGWSSLLTYNRSLLLLHVFSCDQGWAGMFFLGSQEWE